RPLFLWLVKGVCIEYPKGGIDKLSLKGGMLPDPQGRLARAYGVRSLFGFYSRDTFLLNPEGRVQKIWWGVNPFKDADTVLAYLRERLR
ncbi:thioredoxin domain-containing protein, partial [Thermus brockianus]